MIVTQKNNITLKYFWKVLQREIFKYARSTKNSRKRNISIHLENQKIHPHPISHITFIITIKYHTYVQVYKHVSDFEIPYTITSTVLFVKSSRQNRIVSTDALISKNSAGRRGRKMIAISRYIYNETESWVKTKVRVGGSSEMVHGTASIGGWGKSNLPSFEMFRNINAGAPHNFIPITVRHWPSIENTQSDGMRVQKKKKKKDEEKEKSIKRWKKTKERNKGEKGSRLLYPSKVSLAHSSGACCREKVNSDVEKQIRSLESGCAGFSLSGEVSWRADVNR